MRRYRFGAVILGTILACDIRASAQSSLDLLQEELKEAKQTRQDVTSQTLSNFFAQIDPAMSSADAALTLYQQAGGPLPDPNPVITQNEDETATEKANRLALDQANLARLAVVLKLQCGMMHYGALLIVKPDQAGLHDQWVTWLKSAALAYPQTNLPPGTASAAPAHKKKERDGESKTPAPPFNPSEQKGKALKDTPISKFLAFNAWGDKEPGGWSVKDLPRLYRANVLEPLRLTPSTATLEAWNAYIALANSDEPDNDKWNQVVFPPLQFDRGCDDYAVAPSTEKLEALVNLIKASPTNSHADEWIARVGGLMDDYRSKHGGTPAAQAPAPSPAPTTDPNVSVTTVQQGDATIITTHTNSAPVAPAH